ncbi:hypothetical protein Lste_2371 [Legionella steelei]|uniref:Uncharacterized protein n=1 Tax=Legionella steelei TaxID=947033 RepID=A0A0W0ZJ21_9GAMM|nr:hypothetical protein [Legionella steelei]KTD69213.1 hypothetical protein Lste_2371 [Legionella steelei]
MKEKFEELSKRLTGLGINHQSVQENDNDLMQQIAYIDYLNHAAYKEIEEQYAQFDPNADMDAQLQFFKKIIAIKSVLRELQVVHNELTKNLCQKEEIYIHNEQDISFNEKYILPALKGKQPREIVRANFYQLLDNINKNNSLGTDEAAYINSLLMQLVSRPGGIKLIVKLNYLLATKDAQLILKPSENFECSMASTGFAKINPNYNSKLLTPDQDFRTILKRETAPGAGTQKILVGVDYRYNDKIASLNLDTYASTGNGLTDAGPPFILLAHELIHGVHNLTGKARNNFGPFFQGPKYRDDPLMSLLYPPNSLYSMGPGAEEYWTIEGGNLCENLIRQEHGFFGRTGHISSEPGSRGIRDLYYLGLARSYNKSHLERYLAYINNLEEAEDHDEEDVIVERLLRFEKFKSLSYSLADLVKLSQSFSPFQLNKIEKVIAQFNVPSDESLDDAPVDKEQILEHFLVSLHPKAAQLLVVITNGNMVDNGEEIELDLLNQALPAIQKINELLKTSNLSPQLLEPFARFTEHIETKVDLHHHKHVF